MCRKQTNKQTNSEYAYRLSLFRPSRISFANLSVYLSDREQRYAERANARFSTWAVPWKWSRRSKICSYESPRKGWSWVGFASANRRGGEEKKMPNRSIDSWRRNQFVSLSPWPATADLVAETFTCSEIALRNFISEINSFGNFFASRHACIVREPFFRNCIQ